jgi:hypothetical protein
VRPDKRITVTKQTQTAETQSEKKHRPLVEPVLVEGVEGELAGLAQLPGGPLAASGNGMVQTVAKRLGDPMLQDAQRQAFAAHIGRLQGNGHLQRAVSRLNEDEPPRRQSPETGIESRLFPVQRTPDEPVDVEYQGQRLRFESRDELARFLSANANLVNLWGQDLAERDQRFFYRETQQAQRLVITINLRVIALAAASSPAAMQRLAISVLRDKDNLQESIRDAEASERRHYTRQIANQVQREARRMEQLREGLLEQMHRAFRANNEDLIADISGAYGRVGTYINQAAQFYDQLRRWDGRVEMGISVYTNFLGNAMSVANYLAGLGDEVPGLASPTEQALGHLTRAYNTASTLTSLLGISVPMYGVLTAHIGPALTAISRCWARVEDQMRHENDTWYELYGEEMVDWSVEPGGRAVHDYLARVFHASGPGGVPPIPDGVGQFFLDNRALLNAAMRAMGEQEMPTERVLWILWHRIQRERFKAWIFANREMVWRLIYGTRRRLPTEEPAVR